MPEKRRALRFVPSKDICVSLHCPRGDEVVAPLRDLSASGLMVLVPEGKGDAIRIGDRIDGEIALPDNPLHWQGHVVHRSPNSRGLALGISADGDAAQTMHRGAQWLADLPDAGALRLAKGQSAASLAVIGHLSFGMSRDFMHLLRRQDVKTIDLSRCHGMDSAGLGMLCIARDMKKPLCGARGKVATLLQIAGIACAPQPA